jgi:hypothetical protein
MRQSERGDAPLFGGPQRGRLGLLPRRLVHCPASVRDRGERRGRVYQQVLHRFPDDAKPDLIQLADHLLIHDNIDHCLKQLVTGGRTLVQGFSGDQEVLVRDPRQPHHQQAPLKLPDGCLAGTSLARSF